MPQNKKRNLAIGFYVWGLILIIITAITSFNDEQYHSSSFNTNVENAVIKAANKLDSIDSNFTLVTGISFLVVGTFIDSKERQRQYYHDATQYQLAILNQNVAQLNAKLNALLPDQPENTESVPPAAPPIATTVDLCPTCGVPKIPNTAFCTKCGAKLQ